MSDYGIEKRKQIKRVLEYIDDHLSETLTLESLAKVSTYSVYYFQRTFKAIVGETPAAYVKRNRLEQAAHLLIYERLLPITEIAYRCGFSSLSYFTQSFGECFCMSPKQWREDGYLERFPREYEESKKSKVSRKISKADRDSQDYNQFRWLDLERVKVEILPVCRTVNSQSIGPYTEGIDEAWEDIYHWAAARDLIQPEPFLFGVPRNNPYITSPEKSRYDCRVAIDSTAFIDDEELTYAFRGGKHVVYEFEQPVSYQDRGMLIECYSELYSFWLPKSGYRYLDDPVELVEIKRVKGSFALDCKIKAIALAIEPK